MRDISILVVDEDRYNVESIQEALEHEDRTFLSAYSSDEALQIASKISVNMIILDFCTSMQKGGNFMKSMFGKGETPNVPVFMMSYRDDLSTKLLSYVSGAIRFFPKPVDIEDLRRGVEQIEKRNLNPQGAAIA